MTDDEIAAAIRACLAGRRGTICPSEAARALAGDWRPLMPLLRAVAAAMPDVVALQRGTPVDPSDVRGPIRLARR